MSDEPKTERDYVYLGRRSLSNGKIGHAIAMIMEDGSLGPERCYSINMKRVIGGVYRGAAFAETKSYGLDNAKYARRWDDQSLTILWEASDSDTQLDIVRNRHEKDAKANSQLNACLLPLRRAMHAAHVRGDYHGARAIREAAATLLAKPLTKEEEKP